jgi:phosphoesterase RecJ-like protein
MPLGGGGHAGAAGCRVDGTLAEARVVILDALKQALTPSTGSPESH